MIISRNNIFIYIYILFIYILYMALGHIISPIVTSCFEYLNDFEKTQNKYKY